MVQRVLRETGLCASALELEITENTILCNEARIHAALQALRDIGIVLMALALLTGWARIHVGVHFPFDILAGFLLAGVLTGLFAAAHHVVRRSGRLIPA